MEPPRATRREDKARRVLSRRVELAATVVMAAAAILTAWSAFQSTKWHGVQSVEYNRSNQARVEALGYENRADALRSVDLAVFLSWLGAVGPEIREGTTILGSDGEYQPVEGSRSAFYFWRMRDEFRPALDAWIATQPLASPDAPASPFVMAEYRLAEADSAARLANDADEHATAALEAARHADNHVLTAVVLAMAIFFAGIATKLESDRNRMFMILLSDLVFVGALTVLIVLPKQTPW